jgi:hypothetical protein
LTRVGKADILRKTREDTLGPEFEDRVSGYHGEAEERLMTRVVWVILAALLLAGAASAQVDCVFGASLQSYIDLGNTGCYIGDKIFSDFSYTYSGDYDASEVTVQTDTTPMNPGFTLLGSWGTATGGSDQDLFIEFNVSGPSIKDASIFLSGVTIGAGGDIAAVEDLCLGGVWTSPGVCSTGVTRSMTALPGGGGSILSNSIDWEDDPGPVSYVGVQKNIKIFGSDEGPVGFSVLTENFSQVPEPSTYLLMGAGLMALGFVRRRMRKH